eukprot:XP_001709530.1 Hypothetical protein GL50803_21866 [Giardia lamblia ATCC 50803]
MCVSHTDQSLHAVNVSGVENRAASPAHVEPLVGSLLRCDAKDRAVRELTKNTTS